MPQFLRDVDLALIPGMENDDKGAWNSRSVVPINYYTVRGPDGQAQPIFYRTPGYEPITPAPLDNNPTSTKLYNYWFFYDGIPPVTSWDITVLNNAVKRNGVVLAALGAVHGPKQFMWNGTQLAIAESSLIQVIDRAGTLLASINTAATFGEQMAGCTYQDGYGIVAIQNTEKFFISGLDDLTTWNALDFSTADVFADLLVGVESDHRELYLFGRNSIEIWQNTGAAAFPFQRGQGGFIEKGCLSQKTICKIDHKLFFVGSDRSVWMLQGYQPTRVSTEAIEEELRYQALYIPEAFTYQSGGRSYYVLSIGQEGVDMKTYVYDIGANSWHRRRSYWSTNTEGNGAADAYWDVRFVFQDPILGAGKNVCARRSAPEICYLNDNDPSEHSAKDATFDGLGWITASADPGATVVGQKLNYGGKRFVIHRVRLLADSASTPTSITMTVNGISRTTNAPIFPYEWVRLGSYREARLQFTIKSAAMNIIRGAKADIEVFDS